MKDIKCDCDGTMRPAKLATFDLTEDLGIRVTAEDVHGLRCNRCGWETLPGKTMNAAMNAVAAMMLEVEERLSADFARYLRKHLGLTQQELARRMGITRKTVIALAKKRGMEVVERRIMPEELASFNECFICGTGAEVTPVSEIGPHTYKPARICETMLNDYAAAVRPKKP